MPRYIVERTFPAGLQIPAGQEGAQACLAVVNRNAVDSVTWVHSYVAADKKRRSASTTPPRRRRSAGRPTTTHCPWTASPMSARSIPTSTSKGGDGNEV